MSTSSESDRRNAALAYLREQLGARAPAEIQLVASFHETPLDGEGGVSLFSFPLEVGKAATAGDDELSAACSKGAQTFFVFSGETVPNYSPAYDLGPDDAYSLHIGTRFALEVGVSRLDSDREPPAARSALHEFLHTHLSQAKLTAESVAGVFAVGEQIFVVYRLTLNDETVFFLGADAPPGFYRLAHVPPQVSLRLHLGKLIREEARQEQRGRGGA